MQTHVTWSTTYGDLACIIRRAADADDWTCVAVLEAAEPHFLGTELTSCGAMSRKLAALYTEAARVRAACHRGVVGADWNFLDTYAGYPELDAVHLPHQCTLACRHMLTDYLASFPADAPIEIPFDTFQEA